MNNQEAYVLAQKKSVGELAKDVTERANEFGIAKEFANEASLVRNRAEESLRIARLALDAARAVLAKKLEQL